MFPDLQSAQNDRFPNKWNPHFWQFSYLFFPIMPHVILFSNSKDWPTFAELNSHTKNITTWSGQPLKFVPQYGDLVNSPLNNLYEPRIFLTGEVNTRKKSWHDFFNAMIWLTFPKTKSVLNMRQFIAYDENSSFPWSGKQKKRIREQEVLTMLDEGGCLIIKTSDKIKIPLLFGHGFYERFFYGDRNLSALSFEIEVTQTAKEIVHVTQEFNTLNFDTQKIDDQCAKLCTHRNFYENEDKFFALHYDEMKNLLLDLKRF